MKITIASAQYPIALHNSIQDWKNYTENWVKDAVSKKAQLLLFPEYGSMELVSIFSVEVQADLHGQIEAMQSLLADFKSTYLDISIRYGITIVAPSFPVKIGQKFHNRAFVFGANGEVGYQDKLFMTRFETEEWGIHAAPKVLTVFEAEWGSFGIQICYDSEFSIATQQLAQNGMDVLLVPSCTETLRGATRVHVGTRARAMEQQVYGVVSQTIKDALWSPAVDVNFGYTAFYSTPDKNFPEDGIIAIDAPQQEGWLVQTLDLQLLKTVKEDGQVLNYKDHLRISQEFIGESIQIQKVKI